MENKDIVYFVVLFLCLFAIAGLLFYMKSEGGQCLKNPYLYGASKMGDIQCSCTQLTEGAICPATFSFNETTFDNSPTVCSGSRSLYKNIDLNSLNITP